MILLQLSAGQGPLECCLAVGLAGKQVEKACGANQVCCQIVESVSAGQHNCFHSVLLQLEGVNSQELAREWQGVMQWIEPSPFRPQHKRKNWFFSGQVYVCDELEWDTDIRYQTCRASGAGGQHVNTTDSAVRATHTVSGMSVRVESERSQHANKRLARMLLFQKIHALHAQRQKQQDKQRWQQHGDLERGNAVKVFVGKRFLLK